MIRLTTVTLTAMTILAIAGSGTAAPTPPTPTIAQRQTVTRISAGQVQQILDAVQQATEKADIKTILSYLAPNATLEIRTQSSLTGPQTLKLSREEYRRYLEEGFQLIKASSSRMSDLKVQVAPNGRTAIATYQITEETTLKDQPITFSSVGTESVTFAIVQGRVLATQVRSNARVEIKQ
ncbi:nuclear transport factor 2 family protein [Leptolyngbya sp. FACHB-36]|uniref:nuclear transport factor 2 family protein n=1 Tax=Leptolyngbya sp. FACHB-36 TaxID=2692808 RepID=UPI00168087F4|nr:nuclear transport factor 2 family protein [Leptolyngbya sp. FACHB-36]MBD2018723.1 nuclear transport factor 2 family protein [Leptolyngbya sp. FACHB-36]